MRTLFRLLCYVVLLPVLIAGGGDRLRLVSLNAEWFPGRVPESSPVQQSRHIVLVQKLLHDLDPDLLLLQEILKPDALEKTLAVQPDLSLYTVSRFADNPLQLALAGRLPLFDADTHVWTMVSESKIPKPPRGMAYAAVRFPDGDVLLIVTVHLKSNWRGDEDYDEKRNVQMREQSIEQFLAHVRDLEKRFDERSIRGVLLGGDLNTLYPRSLYRHEQTLSLLEKGGFVHLGGNGLDQFWGKDITNITVSVFSDYAVSDHAPVILDVALATGQTLKREPPLDPATLVAATDNLRSDINRASRSELMSLPLIGPVLAQRIIEGRPFKSVGEMVDVCGIGPITFERIKPYVDAVPVDK